jgi:hypothetical protein
MEALEAFLSLAQIAGILDCVAVRVSVVGFEPDIDANLPASCFVLDMPLCDDMTHECHENQELINGLEQSRQDGEISDADANRIYRGKTLGGWW